MAASQKPRVAKEIIDQAIAENRASERLLYCMASAFAVVGLVVLVIGATRRQQLTALAGGVSAALFVPAVRLARQTRRENIAIRLLESPLGRADTARQASEAVQHLVGDMLRDRTPVRETLSAAAAKSISKERA